MKLIKFFGILFLLGLSLMSQAQEKVLFTIDNNPVLLDEFLYIYEKTNRNEADFSEASVKEYLDLYSKFKLKVHKAKAMRLDTIKALQTELAGYRKQLANTYLSDKEVLSDLTQEAYQRMQEDVSFSHIFFKLSPDAAEDKATTTYEKALAALERLRDGENFEKVALEVSEDNTVQKNKGKIGYTTAMLPDGFYDLETALYTLSGNKYSRPIRSKVGYHIIKVHSKRPARGEIEVGQILIRAGRDKNSKSRIDTIYQKLQDGAKFEEMAQNYSEDKQTSGRGGYLGFFGINKYESIFENTAFRLREDGAISRPIKTSIGWHVIKRISLKPKLEYDETKRSLEAKVRNDKRFSIAENALMDKIKEDNHFKEMDWDKEKFLTEIGDKFLTYQWKAPTDYTNQTLYSIGSEKGMIDDLLAYLTKNTATRLRMNRTLKGTAALGSLYDSFLEEKVIEFEENQLENKFPEFKALMREYSEGILLFEATKMKVWDRASTDTVGLKSFYQANSSNYLWPSRALIETITILSQDEKVVAKISKKFGAWSSDKMLKKFNKKSELVRVQSKLIDQDQLDPDLTWVKHSTSSPFLTPDNKSTIYKRVAQITAPKRKSIDEARGYIIADYQDRLEKEWVKELTKAYKIVVNEDVLSSIIK